MNIVRLVDKAMHISWFKNLPTYAENLEDLGLLTVEIAGWIEAELEETINGRYPH